jgi:hypothetical protein
MANKQIPPDDSQDWRRDRKIDVAVRLAREHPAATIDELKTIADARGHSISKTTFVKARGRINNKAWACDDPRCRKAPQAPGLNGRLHESFKQMARNLQNLKASVEALGGFDQARELLQLFGTI